MRRPPNRVLNDVSAVVHLAPISNDPMGNAHEDVTLDVNYRASVALARLAKAAGVQVLRLRIQLQCVRIRRGRRTNGVVRCESADSVCRSKVLTESALADLAETNFRNDLPAIRDSMRNERAPPTGPGAERLRRVGLVDGPDHRAQRRDALAAPHQRAGHGPGD